MPLPVRLESARVEQLRDVLTLIGRDPAAGAVAARQLCEIYRDFPPALRVLALAERRNGQIEQAERLELEAIALALGLPPLVAVQAAITDLRLEEAEVLVRAYLREEDPECPAAALLLSDLARRGGAGQQAVNLARRAILLAPAYDEARMALAHLQRDAGDFEAALATLAGLLARSPDHLPGLSLKAAMLVQTRQMDDADAAFRDLRERHPEDSRGAMNHAFLLKTIGRRDDAESAYRRSIALDPRNGQAWWGLANLKTSRFDAADIATMQSALEREIVGEEERLHLLFALGKGIEDAGDSARAFACFEDAARLRLAQTPYDPEQVNANVRRVAEVFSPEFFAERAGWGCLSADPIFIVSLPRSGSTLVEQILASHPQIEGTEELFDIERIALELAPDAPAGGYLENVAGLSRDQVRELGEHYLAATARIRMTGRPFFTDKMPSNWVFSGLIRLILPNARIIDVRRHPLACGVANFTQHFNWGINYSYDLAHIGAFYSAYVRQMAWFDRAIPGHIHHLTHEMLVDDLEGEVRRMLAYLGLPFDPACLRFHENRRAVHTPSSEQVRQPINRDGMDRWRRYEPWLGPLKSALGSVLDHYPLPPPEYR